MMGLFFYLNELGGFGKEFVQIKDIFYDIKILNTDSIFSNLLIILQLFHRIADMQHLIQAFQGPLLSLGYHRIDTSCLHSWHKLYNGPLPGFHDG